MNDHSTGDRDDEQRMAMITSMAPPYPPPPRVRTIAPEVDEECA